MHAVKPSRSAVRFLTGTGYIFTMLAWTWSGLFYAPLVLQTEWFQRLIGWFTWTQQSQRVPVVFELPAPVALTIGVSVTLIVVAASIYSFVHTPKAVVRTSDKLARQSARLLVPVLAHHRPLPLLQRRRLSARVLFYVKLTVSMLPIIAVLPLAGMLYPVEYESKMTFAVVFVVVAFHSVLAVGCFLLANWLEKRPAAQNIAK